MKTSTVILSLILVLFQTLFVNGQVKSKKDTINYFIDNRHFPILDGMITITVDRSFKFYTINCACLTAGNSPLFRGNIKKAMHVDNINDQNKFVNTRELLALVKKNQESFVNKFVL
jgi:hypothetical protein